MRTITIEVDDFVYEWAERLAAESGAPVEYHVMELLVKYGRNWLPKMTPDEYEQQMARLRRHAGAQDLGYPTGADNECIDADLAREYLNTHEG